MLNTVVRRLQLIILHLKTCFIFESCLRYSCFTVFVRSLKSITIHSCLFFLPIQSRGDQKELEPPAEQLSSLCVPVPVAAVVVVPCCTGQGMSLYSS